MTCVPPCQYPDHCAFFGCPFTREPQSNSVSLCATTKDGAEPSVERLSDPGAVPGASTKSRFAAKPLIRSGEGDADQETALQIDSCWGRNRIDGLRTTGIVLGVTCRDRSKPTCKRQYVCRRTAPRGVSEAGKPAPGNRKTGTFTRTWAFRFGQQPDRISESWPAAGLRDQIVSVHGQQRLHLFLPRANADAEASRHEQKRRDVESVSRLAVLRGAATTPENGRDRCGETHNQFRWFGTPLSLSRRHATGLCSGDEGMAPCASFAPRTKPTPAGLIACQDGTTARGINFSSCGNLVTEIAGTSDYNGIKLPALVTAPQLSRKKMLGYRVAPDPQETQFKSNASTPAPEAAVNPAAHLETPPAELALAKVSCRHRGDGKVLRRRLPTYSRDPQLVATLRTETPAALAAVADHVRRVCFGLLAKGESQASLRSRETFSSHQGDGNDDGADNHRVGSRGRFAIDRRRHSPDGLRRISDQRLNRRSVAHIGNAAA